MNIRDRFGLRTHLACFERSGLNLHWVPITNVLLLVLGLYTSNSKWLCPPGIQIHLPQVSTGFAYASALPLEDSVTVDKHEKIFFQHKIFTTKTLRLIFSNAKRSSHTLHLFVDQQVSVDYLLKIMEHAKDAGYKFFVLGVSEL